MGYESRHAVQRTVEAARKLSWGARTGVAAVAVAGLAGGGLALASGAGAATSLTVSLRSSSDGALAAWNGSTLDLTLGSQSSSTFAEMDVNGVTGQAVPSSQPTFTTDHYAAGSPRWVIDLANGKSLVGYPAASGLNGTDEAWAAGNSGTYTSYMAAYAAAGAGATTVKDAFIVADGDQAAGTTDAVTGIAYNGQNLTGSVDTPPAGAVCYDHSTADPTAACAWQQIGSPGGYELDVSGQLAGSGVPIIAWQGKSGEPSEDFTVAAANGGSYLLEYTPYGNLTNALQFTGKVATSAYSSTGTPLFCVSAVQDTSGQQAQLRGCAGTTAVNQWQDFKAVQFVDGNAHRLWEPSYSGSAMALNDKGYGGNGSPIINYAAIGSWNEEFWPAASAVPAS